MVHADPYAPMFPAGRPNVSAAPALAARPQRQNPRARSRVQFQHANAAGTHDLAPTPSAPHRSPPPQASSSWNALETPLPAHARITAHSQATPPSPLSVPHYSPTAAAWPNPAAAPHSWTLTHSSSGAPVAYPFPAPAADQVTSAWLTSEYTVSESNLPQPASSHPLTPSRRGPSVSPSHQYLSDRVPEATIHPHPLASTHRGHLGYSGQTTSLQNFTPFFMDPASAKMENDVAPPVTNGAHLHDDPMVPTTLSRKRSHDEMVGHEGELSLMPHEAPDPYPQLQPRTLSPHDGQPMTDVIPTEVHEDTLEDGFTPMKGSRSIKRPDPPFNADHKFYCDVSPECEGLTFERKCEWSKHMDKHDRPYRCPHPQCAKLQGFTYSGGLLRHEREVHNKHGGPKSQLICPHPDCKRHTGKGFTRKENLNEHVRRVHDNDWLDGNGPTNKADLQAAQDALAGAEQLASITQTLPYAEGPGEAFQAEEAPMVKRPRTNGARSPSVEVEDLKLEIQRLRAQNEEKDERLRRMEVAEAQREVRLRELENALAQFSGLQHVEGVVEQGGEQVPTH